MPNTDPASTDSRPRPHFYLLLDRSGSMEDMRADVIGGVNRLLADQRALGDDARITLVQFDSQDPQEILVAAKAPSRVRPLSHRTFVPRGGTPLLDATGRIIARASIRQQERRTLAKRPELVTIITVTDGMENQSHEYCRADILALVRAREADGWSFAFLGAGLDTYGEATAIGYDPRSVQEWAPDAVGASAAFDNLSRAMSTRRRKVHAAAPFAVSDFYEGDKSAEADRDARHPSP